MNSEMAALENPPVDTAPIVWVQEVVCSNHIAPMLENKGSEATDGPDPETTGLHSGLHRVTCERCGNPYGVRTLRTDRPRHICQSCRGQAGIAKSHANRTPESTEAERIRAQGLLNKRLRLGWFKPTDACMKCGEDKRLDKHHPDYKKPDEILFLCRRCHMIAHRDPESIAGIEPVKLADRMDGKPIGHGRVHSKGGRRGPTGKAKGKSPSITIVMVQSPGLGETMVETLACGHTHSRTDDGRRAKQRRCQACRPIALPLAA